MNGTFLNDAHAQTCSNNLPVSSVSANGNDGNVPQNVLESSQYKMVKSRNWFLDPDGFRITDTICSVDIAWFSGNQRTSNFVIATSTDGSSFSTVFSGTSSGTTLNSEKYTFSSADARYVRVTVNGNSQNNWASITELDVFGTSSAPSGDYHYSPSLTLPGSNYQDEASTSALQLAQFTVAAWFKTSTNFASESFILIIKAVLVATVQDRIRIIKYL